MKFFSILFLLVITVALCAQQKNPFDIRVKPSTPAAQLPTNSEAVTRGDSVSDVVGGTLGGTALSTSASQSDVIGKAFNPFEKKNNVVPTQKNLPEHSIKEGASTILSAADGQQRDTSIIVLVYSLVMLIILTLAISLDKARFTAMMKSSINSNYLKTLFRDTKAWTNGQGIILYIFFILNAGFAIWLILLKMNSPWSRNLFLMISAVSICYLVRHLVLYAMSSIFNLGSEVAIHNFSIGLHNMMLGVFLLPLIMAIEFLPGMTYTSFLFGLIGLFVIIYLLRQLKGILSCLGMRGFSPFYFFIYLCAIEIAPVLVGYKMMIGAL